MKEKGKCRTALNMQPRPALWAKMAEEILCASDFKSNLKDEYMLTRRAKGKKNFSSNGRAWASCWRGIGLQREESQTAWKRETE
jgi:hypothetical protein